MGYYFYANLDSFVGIELPAVAEVFNACVMRCLPEDGPILPPLILFYAAIDLDFAPADLGSAEFLFIRLPL